MSLIQDLINKVVALTSRLNQIGENSKANAEHPLMDPINRSALLRASVAGLSKYFSIQDLFDDLGTNEFILGNVPAKYRHVVIDFDAAGTTASKLITAINAAPNYVLQQGTLYFFYTNRLVLSNGSGIVITEDGEQFTVVGEYYVLTQKIIPDGGGITSVGVGGTAILNNGIRYFSTLDSRSLEPQEFDLGEIGTDLIEDAVDGSGPYSTPNEATILFRATRSAVEHLWLYLGSAEEVGLSKPPTSAADYREFPSEDDTDPPAEYQETLPTLPRANNGNIRLDNHEGREMSSGDWTDIVAYNTKKERLYGKARVSINAPTQPTVRTSLVDAAGNLEEGREYTIKSVGTTDWVALGASANTVGIIFTTIGVGSGTGEAYRQAIQIGGDVFLSDTNMHLHILKGGSEVEYKFIDSDQIQGGASNFLYQTEITDAVTVLDGTQKGLNKLYPFNKATAQTIQIDAGDYVENDVINIERSGEGSTEFLEGAGVRFRGVRDIDNRRFINDVGSIVSILCRGSEVFSIIGNLKRGYTGAVTTSSYSTLFNGATNTPITVIGTGFSANMLDPVLTGNATLISWDFVNYNQITLHITETGAVDDTITVTYDNGNVFIDTDAITIIITYNTNNLRHYYPLSINSNDNAGSPINGTDTSMNYVDGFAVFDGSNSFISLGDDDSFSYGDGSSDVDLSFSFTINFDDLTPGIHYRILSKWLPSTNQREYSILLSPASILTIQFFDETVEVMQRSIDLTSLSASTVYHFIITKTGSTITLDIDNNPQSLTNGDSASYVAMSNLSDSLTIGALSDATQLLGGKLKRLGLWNVALNTGEKTSVYLKEIINNTDLL